MIQIIASLQWVWLQSDRPAIDAGRAGDRKLTRLQ
jgi:hypothetical protein